MLCVLHNRPKNNPEGGQCRGTELSCLLRPLKLGVEDGADGTGVLLPPMA